jgi:hypothetical protein
MARKARVIAAATLGVALLLKSRALKLTLKLCSRRKLREKRTGKPFNEACASRGSPSSAKPVSNKTRALRGAR